MGFSTLGWPGLGRASLIIRKGSCERLPLSYSCLILILKRLLFCFLFLFLAFITNNKSLLFLLIFLSSHFHFHFVLNHHQQIFSFLFLSSLLLSLTDSFQGYVKIEMYGCSDEESIPKKFITLDIL